MPTPMRSGFRRVALSWYRTNAFATPTGLTIPNLRGEIQVTVTLKKVSAGTELNIVQEWVPDLIPPEACYLGWQESLILPAMLVEAEVP